jgi:hypothetical protein
MPQKFYFSESKNTHVKEIKLGVVSDHVRFVFDSTIEVKAGQMIELDNGQWFLREWQDGQVKLTQLDGKWST